MNDESLVPILVSIIGLIGSILGPLVLVQNAINEIRAERENLERKLAEERKNLREQFKQERENLSLQLESERKITQLEAHRELIDVLYQKRLESYPKAIAITQEIGKAYENKKSPAEIIEINQDAYTKLHAWNRDEGYLLMSSKTYGSFLALIGTLRKNPETKDGFSEKQLENIWYARNKFRPLLREDLGHLFVAEEEFEGS